MPEEVAVMSGMHSSVYGGSNQPAWFPSSSEYMYMSHGFGFSPLPNAANMSYSQPKMQNPTQQPSESYVSHFLSNLCSAVSSTFTYFTGMRAPPNPPNHIPQSHFSFGNTMFDMNVINEILSCSKLNPEAAEFWPNWAHGFQDCRRKGPWANCQGSSMKEAWAKGFHHIPTAMKEESKGWAMPAFACDMPYDLVSPQGATVLEEGLQSIYYESIQEYNKSRTNCQQQQKVVEDMARKFTDSKVTHESQIDNSTVAVSDLIAPTNRNMQIGCPSDPKVPSPSDQTIEATSTLSDKVIVDAVSSSPDSNTDNLEESFVCREITEEDLTNDLMGKKLSGELFKANIDVSVEHDDNRNEDSLVFSQCINESLSVTPPHLSPEQESPKEDWTDDAPKYLKTETIPCDVQNAEINKDDFQNSVENNHALSVNSKPVFSEPEQIKQASTPKKLSYADIVKGKRTFCNQTKMACEPKECAVPSSTVSDTSLSPSSTRSKFPVSYVHVTEDPMEWSFCLSETSLPTCSKRSESPVQCETQVLQSLHLSEIPVPPSSHEFAVPEPSPSLVSDGPIVLSSPLSFASKDTPKNSYIDTTSDGGEMPEKTAEVSHDEPIDELLELSGFDLESSTLVRVDESFTDASSDEESDEEDTDDEWTSSPLIMDGGRRRNFSESSNTSSDGIVFSDSCSGFDLSVEEIDGSLMALRPEGDSNEKSAGTGCSVKLLEFICPDDSDDDDDEEIVFTQNLPSERTCMWVQKSCELSIKSTNALPEFDINEPTCGYEVYVSFSTAADDDIEQTSEELEREVVLREVNRKWNQLCDGQPEKQKTCTKVKFQEAVMIVDVPADEERKGPWAMYALDSERFRRRIEALEKVVSPVLCRSHRDTVYTERFA